LKIIYDLQSELNLMTNSVPLASIAFWLKVSIYCRSVISTKKRTVVVQIQIVTESNEVGENVLEERQSDECDKMRIDYVLTMQGKWNG